MAFALTIFKCKLHNKINNISYSYYLNDEDVKKDNELQRYVNEISADGKGPDGGRGMVSIHLKFESSFERRFFSNHAESHFTDGADQ